MSEFQSDVLVEQKFKNSFYIQNYWLQKPINKSKGIYSMQDTDISPL